MSRAFQEHLPEADLSNDSIPDVCPVITFDIGLGEHVDDIDIDYNKLVDYMYGKGFNDSQIATTAIRISAKENHSKSKRNPTITQGDYTKKTDSIRLFPIDTLKASTRMKQWFSKETDDVTDSYGLNGLLEQGTNDHTAAVIEKTLKHELEHKAVNLLEGGMPEAKKYTKRISRKEWGRLACAWAGGWATIIGTNALVDNNLSTTSEFLIYGAAFGIAFAKSSASARSHSHYLNNPEEIRCREAGEMPFRGLVTASAKYEPTTAPA